MSKLESPNNISRSGDIDQKVKAIHAATLSPGFYGTVRLEWQVKDGSIQQDIKVGIEETIRLQSSQP